MNIIKATVPTHILHRLLTYQYCQEVCSVSVNSVTTHHMCNNTFTVYLQFLFSPCSLFLGQTTSHGCFHFVLTAKPAICCHTGDCNYKTLWTWDFSILQALTSLGGNHVACVPSASNCISTALWPAVTDTFRVQSIKMTDGLQIWKIWKYLVNVTSAFHPLPV